MHLSDIIVHTKNSSSLFSKLFDRRNLIGSGTTFIESLYLIVRAQCAKEDAVWIFAYNS